MRLSHQIDGLNITVNTEDFPLQEVGLPGSILDIALGNGIRLNHSCGGTGACTTCHVYVLDGLQDCNPPNRVESERLKEIYGRRSQSRLACQCVPRESVKVVLP